MDHRIFSFGIGIILGTATYQLAKLILTGSTDYIGVALLMGGAVISFYGIYKKEPKHEQAL